MSRNSKRNRKPHKNPYIETICGCAPEPINYNAIEDINDRTLRKNFQWLYSLMLNRFRWVNIPSTCNVRYLESCLLSTGMATFCHDPRTPDVWVSVQAVPTGEYNIYGEPTRWRAMGYGGSPQYEVTPETGCLIFENNSFIPPWGTIHLLAEKLTRYDRAEDVNLMMQAATLIIETSEDRQQELINTVKNLCGFDPITLGISGYGDSIETRTVTSGIPFICDKLHVARQNVLNECYRFAGIDHLAFEKGERMIEEEAEGNSAPTMVKLMDELSARRKACEYMRDNFPGWESADCVFNDDYESYNWNIDHTAKAESDEQEQEVSDDE